MKKSTESALTVYIPMKLPSLANTRFHWRAMARLKKSQKMAVALHLPRQMPSLPATVTLTRIGKRMLDDDNLASAFKAVRDLVASAFGVDDGSNLYSWKYDQRIGKEYGIEIKIESKVTA